MKKIVLFAIMALLFSCKDNTPATGSFGVAFDHKNAVTLSDALASYNSGKDTIYAITGTIENVCEHTGCWLSFKDASGKEFFVNNDESYKIPATGKGHKATANGKFVKDDKGEVSFMTTGIVIE